VESVTWDFGDGSINQTGATATHTYDRAGTYTVRCAVNDLLDNTTWGIKNVTVAKALAPAPVPAPGGSGIGGGDSTPETRSGFPFLLLVIPIGLAVIVLALAFNGKQSHRRRRF